MHSMFHVFICIITLTESLFLWLDFVQESEDSEKMDEDSKIIEGLRENNEVLKAQIRHLEKSLNQAIVGQEEVKLTNNIELQKSKEIIDDLNKKVASLRSVVDVKNVELLNLQTALGQYYAEIEAKVFLFFCLLDSIISW